MKLETVVDQLGCVKSQIADLTEAERKLKKQLIESGSDTVEGKLFHVVVVRCEVSKVDYKAITAKMSPSRQLLQAYTTVSDRVTVRVTSRNGNDQ